MYYQRVRCQNVEGNPFLDNWIIHPVCQFSTNKDRKLAHTFVSPYPHLFGGVRILFGEWSRAKPGEGSRWAKPFGSRRKIGKMRVKIQSPRLHFLVSFICNFFSKFTRIIHKSCTLKQHNITVLRHIQIY